MERHLRRDGIGLGNQWIWGWGGRRIWGLSGTTAWSAGGWRGRYSLREGEKQRSRWEKSDNALSLGPAQRQVPAGLPASSWCPETVASAGLQLGL